MKYRIYRHSATKGSIKTEILTNDIEAERKIIQQRNPGRVIYLSYEHLNEPYVEEKTNPTSCHRSRV